MEKTLTIDGRQVKFKSTGGTLIRYRNQFNSEFLQDLMSLQAINLENLNGFTYKPLEQIIWVLAKTADDSIPDILSWFDSFDEFPINKVWNELAELVNKSLGTNVKNA